MPYSQYDKWTDVERLVRPVFTVRYSVFDGVVQSAEAVCKAILFLDKDLDIWGQIPVLPEDSVGRILYQRMVDEQPDGLLDYCQRVVDGHAKRKAAHKEAEIAQVV